MCVRNTSIFVPLIQCTFLFVASHHRVILKSSFFAPPAGSSPNNSFHSIPFHSFSSKCAVHLARCECVNGKSSFQCNVPLRPYTTWIPSEKSSSIAPKSTTTIAPHQRRRKKTPTTERIFMNVVARCIRSFRNGSNGSVIARVSTLCGKVGAFFSSTTTTIFHFVV